MDVAVILSNIGGVSLCCTASVGSEVRLMDETGLAGAMAIAESEINWG